MNLFLTPTESLKVAIFLRFLLGIHYIEVPRKWRLEQVSNENLLPKFEKGRNISIKKTCLNKVPKISENIKSPEASS